MYVYQQPCTQHTCVCTSSHALNTLYVYQQPCTQHTSFITQTQFVSTQTATLTVNAASCSSHFYARRLLTKTPNDSLHFKQHINCICHVSVLVSIASNVLHRPSTHSCLKTTLRIETCSNLHANRVFKIKSLCWLLVLGALLT